MDPSDLLYLHATLASTLRTQQDQISQLQAEIKRLNDLLSDAPSIDDKES